MSAVVPAGSTVAGAVARASVGADAAAVCLGSVHACMPSSIRVLNGKQSPVIVFVVLVVVSG